MGYGVLVIRAIRLSLRRKLHRSRMRQQFSAIPRTRHGDRAAAPVMRCLCCSSWRRVSVRTRREGAPSSPGWAEMQDDAARASCARAMHAWLRLSVHHTIFFPVSASSHSAPTQVCGVPALTIRPRWCASVPRCRPAFPPASTSSSPAPRAALVGRYGARFVHSTSDSLRSLRLTHVRLAAITPLIRLISSCTRAQTFVIIYCAHSSLSTTRTSDTGH